MKDLINVISASDAAIVVVFWSILVLVIRAIFSINGIKRKRVSIQTIIGGTIAAVGIFLVGYSYLFKNIDASITGSVREISIIAVLSIVAFFPLDVLQIIEFILSDPTRIALNNLIALKKLRKETEGSF